MSTDTQVTSGTEAFLLKSLKIDFKGGSIIDLTPFYVMIEVFEDIFKPSITGSITINDPVGGLEKFVITGGEKITIEVKMPNGVTTLINRSNLILHEFSKIRSNATDNLRYKLYFTSDTSLNSHKKRIFKSSGAVRSVDTIVKYLYSTMAGDASSTYVKVSASDVWLPSPFLSPGYSPIDAINSLAKRTSADGKYYVFYERLNNNSDNENYHHYFRSVDDIFRSTNSTGKIIPTIIYSPASNYFTTTTPETNIRAKTLEYQNNYNHLSSMTGGFYNSRVRSLDVLSRRYSDTKINYREMSDVTGGSAYTNKFLESSNYFSTYGENDYPGERIVVSPMNEPFLDKKAWIKNDTYGAFLNSSIRINVDITGGMNRLGVGDLASLTIPSRSHKSVNLENSIVTPDIVYSGTYLITACRHRITPQGYTKKLELSRGNFRLNMDQLIAQAAQ